MLNRMRLTSRYGLLWLLLPLAGYFVLAQQVSWRPRTLGQWDATGVGPSPVAFSPAGRWLASGATGGLSLWDMRSQQAYNIPGVPYPLALAFSRDSKTLAVTGAGAQQTVLCDVRTHTVRRILSSKHGHVDLCFASDAHTLAIATVAGLVELWDCRGGILERIITASHRPQTRDAGRPVFCPASVVHITFIGNTLVTGDDQSLIKQWDIKTGHLQREWRGLKGGVSGLTASSDGSMLASGSTSGAVQFWTMPSAHLLRSFPASGYFSSMAFSADKRIFAAITVYRTVILRDMNIGQLQRTINANATSLVFAPDGKTLATCDEEFLAPPGKPGSPVPQMLETQAKLLLWRIQ